MNIAIYARCSTTRQELESQIKILREWASKQGYENPVLYQDYAVSGVKTDRKGIQTLLNDVENVKYEKVGVLELSRVGRSIKFIYEAIERLQKAGVKIVLANSNTTLDYNTLEGRALIGGLALAADIEWMLISERNARGRQTIKDKDIKVGRKQKDISVKAIAAMLKEGMSRRKIAIELGVSAPTILRRLEGLKCPNNESSSKS